MAVYDGDLYILGEFDSVEGVSVSRIARYDGINWHSIPVRIGSDSSPTKTLFVYKGELYIGGIAEDTINGPFYHKRITKWDGTTWSNLGAGLILQSPQLYKGVSTMVEYNGLLYVGGEFRGTPATPNVPGLGTWDGNNWVQVIDTSFLVPWVTDMEVNANGILIGGKGGSVYGQPTNGVTFWDGSDFLDMNFPTGTPDVWQVIAGDNFHYANGKLDTGNVWNQFLITDWFNDHMFIEDFLLYTYHGVLYKMDTSTFQKTLIDSIPGAGNSTQTQFCFYRGKLIMSGYDSTGTRLYQVDSSLILTKMNEPFVQDFKFFPNPANDRISFQLEDPYHPAILSVYGLRGKRISSHILDPGSTQLDVSHLPEGIYLIRSEDGRVNEKVVIKR